MDMSETYIKMCERAQEIQRLQPDIDHIRHPEDEQDYKYTSFFYLPKEDKIAISKWDNDEGHILMGHYLDEETGAIWLPRQDQLQKMLISPRQDFIELLEDFYWHWAGYKTEEKYPWREYIEDEDKIKIRGDFTSMEQLWLAFVMKEKFGKYWSKGEWLKLS
jgi:hypothetical protein